jgi:hypothetical protein
MKNGHVVASDQPLTQVIADVNEIILRFLTARIALRYGLEQTP